MSKPNTRWDHPKQSSHRSSRHDYSGASSHTDSWVFNPAAGESSSSYRDDRNRDRHRYSNRPQPYRGNNSRNWNQNRGGYNKQHNYNNHYRTPWNGQQSYANANAPPRPLFPGHNGYPKPNYNSPNDLYSDWDYQNNSGHQPSGSNQNGPSDMNEQKFDTDSFPDLTFDPEPANAQSPSSPLLGDMSNAPPNVQVPCNDQLTTESSVDLLIESILKEQQNAEDVMDVTPLNPLVDLTDIEEKTSLNSFSITDGSDTNVEDAKSPPKRINTDQVTKKLINKVARMDKQNIKELINNPNRKYATALESQARRKNREEMRKQRRIISCQDTADASLEPDECIDSSAIPLEIFEEIGRVLNVNMPLHCDGTDGMCADDLTSFTAGFDMNPVPQTDPNGEYHTSADIERPTQSHGMKERAISLDQIVSNSTESGSTKQRISHYVNRQKINPECSNLVSPASPSISHVTADSNPSTVHRSKSLDDTHREPTCRISPIESTDSTNKSSSKDTTTVRTEKEKSINKSSAATPSVSSRPEPTQTPNAKPTPKSNTPTSSKKTTSSKDPPPAKAKATNHYLDKEQFLKFCLAKHSQNRIKRYLTRMPHFLRIQLLSGKCSELSHDIVRQFREAEMSRSKKYKKAKWYQIYLKELYSSREHDLDLTTLIGQTKKSTSEPQPVETSVSVNEGVQRVQCEEVTMSSISDVNSVWSETTESLSIAGTDVTATSATGQWDADGLDGDDPVRDVQFTSPEPVAPTIDPTPAETNVEPTQGDGLRITTSPLLSKPNIDLLEPTPAPKPSNSASQSTVDFIEAADGRIGQRRSSNTEIRKTLKNVPKQILSAIAKRLKELNGDKSRTTSRSDEPSEDADSSEEVIDVTPAIPSFDLTEECSEQNITEICPTIVESQIHVTAVPTNVNQSNKTPIPARVLDIPLATSINDPNPEQITRIMVSMPTGDAEQISKKKPARIIRRNSVLPNSQPKLSDLLRGISKTTNRKVTTISTPPEKLPQLTADTITNQPPPAISPPGISKNPNRKTITNSTPPEILPQLTAETTMNHPPPATEPTRGLSNPPNQNAIISSSSPVKQPLNAVTTMNHPPPATEPTRGLSKPPNRNVIVSSTQPEKKQQLTAATTMNHPPPTTEPTRGLSKTPNRNVNISSTPPEKLQLPAETTMNHPPPATEAKRARSKTPSRSVTPLKKTSEPAKSPAKKPSNSKTPKAPSVKIKSSRSPSKSTSKEPTAPVDSPLDGFQARRSRSKSISSASCTSSAHSPSKLDKPRLWRSPGEKKCIELSVSDTCADTNRISTHPKPSRLKTIYLGHDTVLKEMKEIDDEIIEKQQKKMEIDEIIQRYQQEKLDIENSMVTLHNRRTVLLGTLLAGPSEASDSKKRKHHRKTDNASRGRSTAKKRSDDSNAPKNMELVNLDNPAFRPYLSPACRISLIPIPYDPDTKNVIVRNSVSDDGPKFNGRFFGHRLAILYLQAVDEFLLAASEDGNVYQYELATGQLLNTFVGHTEPVTGFVRTNDRKICSVSLDGFMRIVDLDDFSTQLQAVDVGESIQVVEYSWEKVFMGSKTGKIHVYYTATKQLDYMCLCDVTANIRALRAGREGPRSVLIIASTGNDVHVRDAKNGLLLRLIAVPGGTNVFSILMDGGVVHCGTSTNQLLSYEFASGNRVASNTVGNGTICIRMYGSMVLLCGSYDSNIYAIDKRTGAEICRIPGPGKMLLHFDILHDKIIVATKDSRHLQLVALPESVLNYAQC